MHQRNAALLNDNALKLGLFGANCSSGRTYAAIPERWVASWENNRKLARLGDRLGVECMIPIARWRGYGGESNPNGSTFETVTWASGLLAATERINVFCTVHVTLNHPVITAKQMVTADHIGAGRFGVNLVCGSSQDEFRMFGVDKGEHDGRYAQGAEWWAIVKKLWAGQGPFDFDGTYYQLGGVQGEPGPYLGQDPLMMNAGSSTAGREFAIRFSDLHFDGIKTPEDSAARIAETKRLAQASGRQIQVWTPVGVICRPTRREAVDYLQYLVDHADWGAMNYLADRFGSGAAARSITAAVVPLSGQGSAERRVLARGAYAAVGDPDTVVEEFVRLQAVGLDGLAINFVDYLKELPYFAQEVLPRLEQLGLRAQAQPVH